MIFSIIGGCIEDRTGGVVARFPSFPFVDNNDARNAGRGR